MVGANHPELVREFASDLTPSSFFDNPVGSSVLLRPMDVVKPPQEELQKNKPGVPLPPMKYNDKRYMLPTPLRTDHDTLKEEALHVSLFALLDG